MLLVRFTLPLADMQCTKDSNNASADFDLGSVAKKPGHGTAFSHVVFKRVDKLPLILHTTDVCNEGLGADKDLGTGFSSINGGGVREDGVGCNRLITASDIEGRTWRLAVLLENGGAMRRAFWHVARSSRTSS